MKTKSKGKRRKCTDAIKNIIGRKGEIYDAVNIFYLAGVACFVFILSFWSYSSGFKSSDSRNEKMCTYNRQPVVYCLKIIASFDRNTGFFEHIACIKSL